MTSIAPWPAERAAAPQAREPAPGADRGAGFVRLFVLACFLPYPALAIGRRTGLQLSHALAAAAVPALAARPPRRGLAALLLVLGPVALSGFVNAMRNGTAEAEVMPKEAVSLALAVSALWPAGWLADRGRFRAALGAVAAAVFLHAAVGAVQVEAFSRDEFPLLFVYQNPSFKSLEGWATFYARYMKRPCGLFPEPSALAAALGPWVVVLTGLALDPAALGLSRRDRRLYAAAAVAGVALLTASRSGAALAVLLGVAVAAGGRAVLVRPRSWAAALLVAGVLACGAGFMGSFSDTALDDRIESSWGLRGQSIVTGLTANTRPLDLVFGVGPGQSTAVVRRLLAGFFLPEGQDDMAVWSLAVTHYMENGLVGAAGMAVVLAAAARAVARSSAAALGLGGLLAWLVGVTVTTSYMHLSPLWLFLGVLLEWDRIFPGRPRAGGATP